MIINCEKRFIVMRGLPGSGKTTEAKLRLQAAVRDGISSGVIFSTDDYFVDENGVYRFRAQVLRDFHAMNFDRCVNAFQAGVQLVILDNHNIRRTHYAHYVKAAQLYNYNVDIVQVGGLARADAALYFERCSHNVPFDTIVRNAEEFEEDSSYDRTTLASDGIKVA